MPLIEPPTARAHLDAEADLVFQAALETVRSLPGWEVVTAHPEQGEIRVRARGRLFTPSMDHVVRLQRSGHGTELDIESVTARSGAPPDEKGAAMFRLLLEDRLRANRR